MADPGGPKPEPTEAEIEAVKVPAPIGIVRSKDGHRFTATPIVGAMLNRDADLATMLAAELGQAAGALEDQTLTPERAILAKRVLAAWRAWKGDDEQKRERRLLIIEAFESATGPSAVNLAMGTLLDRLGDPRVSMAMVAAVIGGWSQRGEEHWAPIRALAAALDCGADDDETFRTEFTKARSEYRKRIGKV
jgi:hypothetical protein